MTHSMSDTADGFSAHSDSWYASRVTRSGRPAYVRYWRKPSGAIWMLSWDGANDGYPEPRQHS